MSFFAQKSSTSVRSRALFAALTALCGAACLSPTQIELQLTTDLPCDTFRGVAISVGSPGDVERKDATAVSYDCHEGKLGTLVVLPSGSQDAPIGVRVVAGHNTDVSQCTPPDYGPKGTTSGCVVARRTLTFVRHKPLLLPIALRAVCVGEPCQEGQTCHQGSCVSAAIPAPEKCTEPGACSDDALFGTSGTGGAGGAGGAGGGGGAGGAGSGIKTVFVTSALYTANLGGLAGADMKCQELATAVNLSGSYMAWLSVDNNSPETRFTGKTGPWQLVEGGTVAKDWTELTSGKLQLPINVSEKGLPPVVGTAQGACVIPAVWTATLANGTASLNAATAYACDGWNTAGNTTPAPKVIWGNPNSTNGEWTASGNCNLLITQICGKTASLYCFEQ